MKQLTVGVLKDQLSKMPDNALVYLGDDEELNGIHAAFFVQEERADSISSMSYGSYTKGGCLIS